MLLREGRGVRRPFTRLRRDSAALFVFISFTTAAGEIIKGSMNKQQGQITPLITFALLDGAPLRAVAGESWTAGIADATLSTSFEHGGVRRQRHAFGERKTTPD